jgi:hypothetical protein
MPDDQVSQSNSPNSSSQTAAQDNPLNLLEDLIKKTQDKTGEQASQASAEEKEASDSLSKEQIELLKQQREQETQQLLEQKQRELQQVASQPSEQKDSSNQNQEEAAGHKIRQLDHIKVSSQDS